MEEKIYPARTRPIKKRKVYYTDKVGNSFVKDTDGKYMVTNKYGRGVNMKDFDRFMARKTTKDALKKNYGLEIRKVKRK